MSWVALCALYAFYFRGFYLKINVGAVEDESESAEIGQNSVETLSLV